jgi:hypothetical protein
MPKYEVIITDVTTYRDRYCVAGWDINRNNMVRPEPPGANAADEPSRFWDSQWAGPGKFFDLGNVVRFEANPPPGNFPFPHATEDRIWVKATDQAPTRTLSATQLAATVGVSAGINAAFSGGLVRAVSGKAYVPRDFVGPSLGAITVSANALTVFENTYDPAKPKLRAHLAEAGLRYDLALTADAARTRWLSAGLNALRADIRACNRIHVRLGLSRPFWGRPDECYAQINGLYFL